MTSGPCAGTGFNFLSRYLPVLSYRLKVINKWALFPEDHIVNSCGTIRADTQSSFTCVESAGMNDDADISARLPHPGPLAEAARENGLLLYLIQHMMHTYTMQAERCMARRKGKLAARLLAMQAGTPVRSSRPRIHSYLSHPPVHMACLEQWQNPA